MQQVIKHPLFFRFYVPAAAYEIAIGMLIPLLPLYVNSFDIAYGLIGIILAGEAIGMILADLPAGIWLRRIGSKRLLLSGLALSALSTLALIVVPSVFLILFLRIMGGFGRSAYNMARHAYISDATEANPQRGRLLSFLGGVFRLGAFAGPATAAIIVSFFDITVAFAVSAALTLFAYVIIANTVEASHAADTPPRRHSTRVVMAYTLRRNWRVLLAAGLGQALGQMTRIGRNTLLPLYAEDIIGLNAATISAIISLASGADVVTFYVSGTLMDRFGRKYAIVPCFALQGIGMFFIPFTSDPLVFTLIAIGMGLANGLGAGTMMTLGADLSPPDARGEFLAYWRLIGDAGFTGGPLLVGTAAQILALSLAPFFVMGAGLSAALVFLLFVPETRHYTPPALELA